MKKNVYFLLAFCLFAALANAQKITEKELQGQWDLALLNMGEVTLDIKNKDIIYSEPTMEGLDKETLAGIKEEMMPAFDGFAGSYVKIDGKKITLFLETADTGTYTIKEEDGNQYITINYDGDGTVDEYLITLEGKNLHLFTQGDDEQTMDFVYTKK
jgi:hypothetical protein